MLEKLTIRGFKSIESLVDFPLFPVNVLIGANGAGKSNLLEFFKMLRAMMGLRIAESGNEPFISLEISILCKKSYHDNIGSRACHLHAGYRNGLVLAGEMDTIANEVNEKFDRLLEGEYP